MPHDLLKVLVVTVSDRVAAGTATDRSGPLLVSLLADEGFEVEAPQVVADGAPVEAALRAAAALGYDVVLTTGGTGISPRDNTPEMTMRVLDREVPGVAEALRATARVDIPTSMLSRGVAGIAGRTFIVNLAGSPGAVRDGVAVLAPILRHAVDQLAGGDHERATVDGDPS